MSSMNTNVYCHNVPLHWGKAELEECFSKYGTIVSSRVLKNPQTNVSRGVCFVRFQTHDEASAAIAGVNNTIPAGGSAPILSKFAKENNSNQGPPSLYGGRYPGYGRPHGKPEEDRTNLYIQNLPITHTDEDIKTLFSAYGTVVSTFILTDRETGASRGIGFCRMSGEQDSSAALTGLNGTTVPGATAPLNITFARDSKRKNQHPVYPPPQYPPQYQPYSSYPYPAYGGPQQPHGAPPAQGGYPASTYPPIGAPGPASDGYGQQYQQQPPHVGAYSNQTNYSPYTAVPASNEETASPYAYSAVAGPSYGQQ